ncbi:hypothetical protein [Ralstonia phage phiRSL1]|uniref:Uncharacterized protein n=1 Tax=Ralstonia phage phiRSL1 TaxID=1980924 RepID=B2ZYC8_9CAUD|nr:hypothetical protein RSL1_ORF302 [Ralstonia phage phiRSL1]BAG41748.1 hypothetical protein [Ralstonia phage phiRSL1]
MRFDRVIDPFVTDYECSRTHTVSAEHLERVVLTLADFKPGDKLEFTQRFRVGDKTVTEVRTAVVTLINWEGNGLVSYTGRVQEGMMRTGSGAFDPAAVGTKPFGFHCAVRKV